MVLRIALVKVENKEQRAKEDQWVIRISEDNRKAFEKLYRFYYPRLSQFTFRYVQSRQVAEDLVHNVFYNVWMNRKSLRARGTIRAYLYTAARNQALKFLERRKVRNFTDPEELLKLKSLQVNPEQKLSSKELKEAIIDAVDQLPERRRQVFLMHREDKLTYNEIADVLGISIKTVETQMSRSLKFLRQKLAVYLPSAVTFLLIIGWLFW